MSVKAILDDYYEDIDSGNLEAAAEYFTEDVTWIHTEVWEPHGYETDRLSSRKEVQEFLEENTGDLREDNITHTVDKLLVGDDGTAFLARAIGEDDEVQFFGWAEFEGDEIATFIIAPTNW